MRVFFFGNHDVGIATFQTLTQRADVVGVVAHPINHEEGVKYASLFDIASKKNIKVMRGKGKDISVIQFVRECNPDLIWVADYRYILPTEIISITKFGAINLHPSLLPKYRGRASINWAIINGETEIGLTAHFIDEGVDTGDIITQLSIELDSDHDVGDALIALIPQYQKITMDVLDFFASGAVPRRVQDNKNTSLFSARKPEDGRIDWYKSARSILNLIRAVTHPYPGAFCESHYGKIYIWKARIADSTGVTITQPGTIIECNAKNSAKIQCGDGLLEIIDWTLENGSSVHMTRGVQLF
jgi:methionyl-tRNA formyltransferase